MAETTESQANSNLPLILSPTELIFPPPLNRVITNILKLENTSNSHVGYKIKTTARKRYCVRPNTGVIAPKETIEVQILLNYSKDQPTSLKCKDKFQVQSIFLQPEQVTQDLKLAWTGIPEDSIMKQKLKCHFTSKGTGVSASSSRENGSPSLAPKFAPTIPVTSNLHNNIHDSDDDVPIFQSTLSNVSSSIIDNEIKYDSSEENIPVTTSNSSSHNVTIATTPTTLPVTSTTIHSSASQEKNNNREELVKSISRQLQNVTQERDDFRKEIEKLTSQISQLQKESTSLRQRKVVSDGTSDSVSVNSTNAKHLQLQQKQANLRLIQFVLVAIIFFLLGRYTI